MKKYIPIIVLVVAIVALFLLNKKDIKTETVDQPTTTQEVGTNASSSESNTKLVETPNIITLPTNPLINKYSYTNDKFGFSVDYPNLVATERTDIPSYVSAIIIFGVGDQSNVDEQSRVPNSMAVYIWNDATEFAKMSESATSLPQEKVNGHMFNVYSFTNEDMTSYRYSTVVNGLTYDIGVLNKSDISRFHFN
jgi:hypothetical protein